MKPISAGNYVIRPFIANKSWIFQYQYLQTSSSGISIDVATNPPSSWNTFTTQSSQKNPDGIYKDLLYQSVKTYFYTGSLKLPNQQSSSIEEFYVVNIPQRYFGEGITAGTFQINSPSSTSSLIDNGSGLLISNANTGSVLGSIFYNLGVVVIAQDTSSLSGSIITQNGMFLTTGSQVNIYFSGTQTIYEHQIMCTIEPSEFNYSINPTIQNDTISGSMSGSTFTQSTGSPALDLIYSGTLVPYFTTVGLYNDNYELVALAKVPRALKRIPSTQQTIIVRFDV